MEVYTGDRQIPNGVVLFPDNYNLLPFPETGEILSHDRAAEIRRPPPQKLRPIRYTGRNLTEYSDPENQGLDGSLGSCYGGELGFLTQEPSVKGQQECENTPPAYIGNRATPEIGGAAAAAQQLRSEMDAEIMNLISEGRILEAELSSSSDDDSELSEAIKGTMNRKRKRKTRKGLEFFLESMTRKVMIKQEQMHKQLMEMLEKNEKERIIREEAWKQQEIERSHRDEEIRTEETSRSLALIAFIQNLLGHEIKIPKPSFESSCLEKDEGEISNYEDLKCDPSSSRWPKAEVQALITVRAALDHKFLIGPKGSVWEEVSVGLSKMGYNRTAKKCKEKWENINKYYRKAVESGKKRLENSKSCPYFHELDILYRGGLISSGNAINYLRNEIKNKSM